MTKLTDKQRLFAAEYLCDLNATQAAIRAGYSAKTAGRTAHENLKKPEISAAIREAFEARIERTEITADRVLTEYARLAFSDLRDTMSWNECGVKLRGSGEITDEASAAVQCITETITDVGEDGVSRRTQIKLHDKLGALRDLGKHVGLFGKEGAGVNVNVNVNNAPPAKPLSDFTDEELDFYERILGSEAGENVPNH